MNSSRFADAEAYLAHCRASGWDPVFNCVRHAPHVLADILYMGYPTTTKSPNGFRAIHVAFDIGDMVSAQLLLNAGADPTVRANDGFTIVHYGADRNRFDMLLLALDVYPEGIHVKDEKGNIPLEMAIGRCKPTGEVSDILRELVNRGSIIEDRSIAFSMTARSSALWRYLVARGGRFKGGFMASPAEYNVMVDAVEACRRLATACIGLGRVGGCVQGNGRDVLRLIAKEIWLTRMDDEWYRWNWEIRKRK